KVAQAGTAEETAEPGNQWFTLPGPSERALPLGGHIDSVPNGGWLDGCLNVMAAVEVLRRIAEKGEPPVTVRLVNWADEEGARFGRSLFGSSAAAGSMHDQDELRQLTDRNGVALPDALAAHGVDLDRALGRGQARARAARDRAARRRRRGVHLRRRRLLARDRNVGRRDGGAASRSAPPRRREARRHARGREAVVPALRGRGEHRRRAR